MRFMVFLLHREPAKFLINERKQFVSGLRVTIFDGLEDLGDITHGGRLENTGPASKTQG
jgi:hypothetical protein